MNNEAPIILAFDASSTNVGWCLAQGERYIDSGVYHPRGETAHRVVQIVQWVAGMFAKHLPDIVPIEEPMGSHQNLKTDRLLARVCGNIEGLAVFLGADVLWVHPSKVKATHLHKNARRAAANYVGKAEVSPDEADAIGTWQAALGLLQDYKLRIIISQIQEVQNDERDN